MRDAWKAVVIVALFALACSQPTPDSHSSVTIPPPPPKQTTPPALPQTEQKPRFDRQFNLIFGTEADDVREYIDDILPYSEFGKKELLTAALYLGEAGFRDGALRRALLASQDIAAISLDKERAFSDAVEALATIRRSETVSELSLRRLGFGRAAFSRAAASRGDPRGDAGSAIETIYALLGKKTGKKLGGAFADLSGR